MTAFTESIVEDAVLAWLESTDSQVAHGPDLAPDTAVTKRQDCSADALARAKHPS